MGPPMNSSDESEALRAQISSLETELQIAKIRLSVCESQAKKLLSNGPLQTQIPITLPLPPSIHSLLLLSDSALPLGSFSYSSGLESFLAHSRLRSSSKTPTTLFQAFLPLSLSSVATTQVPYVLAAFRDPPALLDLDNDLDASTPCTVARKASVAQGRALLSVWERCFAGMAESSFPDENEARVVLRTFAHDLQTSAAAASSSSSSSSSPSPNHHLQHPNSAVNAHIAPLFGVVAKAMGLNLEEAAYLFLLNHAKAVLSAAVRAGVMGPYLAQTVLAGQELQQLVRGCLEAVWRVKVEDAGQVVPMLDLWVGRHEVLYTRIFNS